MVAMELVATFSGSAAGAAEESAFSGAMALETVLTGWFFFSAASSGISVADVSGCVGLFAWFDGDGDGTGCGGGGGRVKH